MRREVLCVLCVLCFGISHAEPKLQITPGVQGGVLSTQITTTKLSDVDKARMSHNTASADVYAGAVDITLNRNQVGIARSTHSVCFETFLTTQADYKFTLDVGGHQVVMSDHIVVQHELYQRVSFPAAGSYSYYAITTGTTRMAGEKRAEHRGTISVR
jgi:hypothetical protein